MRASRVGVRLLPVQAVEIQVDSAVRLDLEKRRPYLAGYLGGEDAGVHVGPYPRGIHLRPDDDLLLSVGSALDLRLVGEVLVLDVGNVDVIPLDALLGVDYRLPAHDRLDNSLNLVLGYKPRPFENLVDYHLSADFLDVGHAYLVLYDVHYLCYGLVHGYPSGRFSVIRIF